MTIAHGIRMALRRLGLDLHRFDVHQSPAARLVRLLAANGVDTVIDVGANDGGYAREMREAGYRGKILSFEPLAEAHGRLAAAARRDADWEAAPPMALGAEPGSATINVAGNSTSSSLLPMARTHAEAAPYSAYVGTQTVAVERLDGVRHPLLDRAGAMHLKIDTQGFEMQVLRGAERLLPRIVGLQLELSLVPLYEGQALYREMIDWVAERGYDLCGVMPGFLDPRDGRMLQMDGVFMRRAPVLS